MASHVMHALRTKRSELAKSIGDTERKLTKLRVSLANVDAAMSILSPKSGDSDLEQTSRRTRYFRKNDVSRLVRETRRDTKGPLSAAQVAAIVIPRGDFLLHAKYPSQARNARWAIAAQTPNRSQRPLLQHEGVQLEPCYSECSTVCGIGERLITGRDIPASCD